MGLAAKMSKEGHAVALLTGESTPDQRIAVLNRFRDGKEKVLITTNLMARGIDIEQVYNMSYLCCATQLIIALMG